MTRCTPFPLTENDPADCGVSTLTQRLKLHQRVLLHRCVAAEKGPVRWGAVDIVDTRLAVLGDKVGSGKSYVIMALALDTDHQPARMDDVFLYDRGTVVYTLDRTSDDALPPPPPPPLPPLPLASERPPANANQNAGMTVPVYQTATTLLVVPHVLLSQWRQYLEENAPVAKRWAWVKDTKSLDRMRCVEYGENGRRATSTSKSTSTSTSTSASPSTSPSTSMSTSDPASLDLVLVTSTFYMRFLEIIRRRRLKMRRLVIDEADSIVIPGFEPAPARFTWLVTASFSRLFDGNMASLCCLRNRLGRIAASMPNHGLLVLKTEDGFSDRSFRLPAVTTRTVRCREPLLVHALHGCVDARIMGCLNAGDVEGALTLCGDDNTSVWASQHALVDILVSGSVRALARAKAKVDALERLDRLNGMEHEQGSNDGENVGAATGGRTGGGGGADHTRVSDRELRDMRAHAQRLEQHITSVRERIERCDDICSICFDAIRNKTIVSCCSNAFCFSCVRIWLTKARLCPLCKRHLSPSDLHVLPDAAGGSDGGGSGGSGSGRATEGSDGDEGEEVIVGSRTSVVSDKVTNFMSLVTDLVVHRLPRQGGRADPEEPPSSKSSVSDQVDFDFDVDDTAYRKLLVFSEHEGTFRNVSARLKAANIRHAVLFGTPERVRDTLEAYRHGSLDVILANANYYGSGLNLQCTTDVIAMHSMNPATEQQVVGRAQRCGRVTPLTVWRLVHDNEVERQ